MKVLVSWLREFVDVTASPEEIAKTMSVRGFAVEGLEHVGDGETVIDFEVTGNRPDCMSIAGMAREVATAYDLPMRFPSARGPGSSDGGLTSLNAVEKGDIDVVIENPDLCPRYAGAVADVRRPVVQAVRSPWWAATRRPSSASADRSPGLDEAGRPCLR